MKQIVITVCIVLAGVTSLAVAQKMKTVSKTDNNQQEATVKATARAVDNNAGTISSKGTLPDSIQVIQLDRPATSGSSVSVSQTSPINSVASDLILRDVQRQPGDPHLDQGADNCPTTVITYTDFFDTGTTVGRANNHTPSCSYSNAPDVVYVYMPPVTGWTTVSLCGYQLTFDTILEIYEGPCPGTTWLACNDDYSGCGLQSRLDIYMYAGTQYTIWIDGYSTNAGEYWISIDGPRPPGERGEYAIPLNVPGVATGNTCIYKDDYGFNCAGQDTAGDVIYQVVPNRNMNVTFSLCHSSFDTKLYIADTDSSFYSIIACNDDAANCPCAWGPYRSLLECVPLQAGHHYLIAVDGYSSNCGDYVLTASECPACNVISMPGDIPEVAENCADLNFHQNDPNGGWNSTPQQFSTLQNGNMIFGRVFTYLHNGSPARDTDHYLFTLTERDTLEMFLWNQEYPLQIMIWDTTTGQYILNYSSGGCFSPYFLRTSYCVNPGTYVLFVAPDDFAGAPIPVDYRIQVNWRPCGLVNDACANALPVTLDSPVFTEGTTVGATLDCATNIYPEVWYWFFLNECANVTVEYCGTPPVVPSMTYLFRDGCCTTPIPRHELSFLVCEDGEPSTTFRGLEPGQYFLPISLTSPSTFSFRVTTEDYVPPNDQCEYAGSNWIGNIPGYYDSRTTCATLDVLPACATPATAPGVWFGTTGNGRRLTASTCSSPDYTNFDTRMTVFTCGCDGMVCVGENDDTPSCSWSPLASEVSWCSRMGEQYLILVHGYGASTGRFRITVTDNGTPCSQPVACYDHVLTAPGQVTGTTVGLGNDCNLEPTEDAQVRVVLPQAGWWMFSLCGSNFDTRMYIDTMRCGGTLFFNDNYCGLQSQMCLSLVPDTFFVTIEGNNAAGSYVFSVFQNGQPAPVQGVMASDNLCTGVRITWIDSEEDQLGYRVLRDGLYAGSTDPDELEYMDVPSDNAWHLYSVQAINECLVGVASQPDSGRKLVPITAAVSLTSPTNGTAVLSGELVEYCCTTLPGATFYYFLWDDDPAFTSPYGYGESDPCVTNSFYMPLGTWYWKARAENACGAGQWSAVGTFQLGELAAPQLTIVVEGNQLRLNWNSNPFATSYEVQSSTNSEGGYSFLASTASNTITTSYSLDEKRFYRVIARRTVVASRSDSQSSLGGSQ